MSAKKNQSNELVRECMVSALLKLMETKPISAVTITELAEKAGVSRMAYYRNYGSKEEILTTHLEEIFAAYQTDITKLNGHGSYNDRRNLLRCFQYFSDHSDFMKCLYKSGMGYMLLRSLSDYLIATYYSEDKGIFFYYTLQAFAGSLYNTYIVWILGGLKESCEDMAKIMSDIYSDKEK